MACPFALQSVGRSRRAQVHLTSRSLAPPRARNGEIGKQRSILSSIRPHETWSWKVSHGGNSGVFYRATEDAQAHLRNGPRVRDPRQRLLDRQPVHERVELRPAPADEGRGPARRVLEPRPDRGPRQRRRALAQRREGGELRTPLRRLEEAGGRDTRQELEGVRRRPPAGTSGCRTTTTSCGSGTSRFGRWG